MDKRHHIKDPWKPNKKKKTETKKIWSDVIKKIAGPLWHRTA